jgi:hypothetical protein
MTGMTAQDWRAALLVGVPLLAALALLLDANRIVSAIERRRARRRTARWVEEGEDW